jgi:zinc transport system substrate-binding protein
MISPALTETISKEAGAKVETLDTIESGEQDANYVKTMKENLEKIDRGLALN